MTRETPTTVHVNIHVLGDDPLTIAYYEYKGGEYLRVRSETARYGVTEYNYNLGFGADRASIVAQLRSAADSIEATIQPTEFHMPTDAEIIASAEAMADRHIADMLPDIGGEA